MVREGKKGRLVTEGEMRSRLEYIHRVFLNSLGGIAYTCKCVYICVKFQTLLIYFFFLAYSNPFIVE